MTRAEEDRQTATDMTRTLFTELTQSLQKEGGDRKANKCRYKCGEGQNEGEERLRIKNERETGMDERETRGDSD